MSDLVSIAQIFLIQMNSISKSSCHPAEVPKHRKNKYMNLVSKFLSGLTGTGMRSHLHALVRGFSCQGVQQIACLVPPNED